MPSIAFSLVLEYWHGLRLAGEYTLTVPPPTRIGGKNTPNCNATRAPTSANTKDDGDDAQGACKGKVGSKGTFATCASDCECTSGNCAKSDGSESKGSCSAKKKTGNGGKAGGGGGE